MLYIDTALYSYNLLLVKHHKHNSVTFCKAAHYTNKFDLTQCLPGEKTETEIQTENLRSLTVLYSSHELLQVQ